MSSYSYTQDTICGGISNHLPIDGCQTEVERYDEAIAVIGFSVDFPSASSPEELWSLLTSGRSAVRGFPTSRLDHNAWHNGDGLSLGAIRPKASYYLDRDIAAFDAPFFSITAAEADAMDPQQRGLLEVSFKALENAGIPISHINDTNASVFTGNFTSDYLLLSWKDSERIPKYGATGCSGAMLSNRISSFFNLTGPSITIDTACSSSLVALDMACQSLRRRESWMSIVTGCNLMCSLDLTIALSNMGFLSPDGRSYSFDERANGYARGEGLGALILKPLSSALRDGDTIRALIRATGSNQNGRTNLGQPNKDAQIQLMKDTYSRAGLEMSTTQFVEAHGTGTAIGDPTEATAIGEAFRSSRARNDPIYIGASKANIGHLEGASGIVGVVKAILVLERGVIPPIADLLNVNPAIDCELLNLHFPKECTRWPKDGLRRASVNSFGFGGTNSHVILDDAYHFFDRYGLKGRHCTLPSPIIRLGSQIPSTVYSTSVTISEKLVPRLMIWSAVDKDSTKRLCSQYQLHLDTIYRDLKSPNSYLASLASTLCQRRSIFQWRTFAVANTMDELRESISKLPDPVLSCRNPRLGLVFTGQGAQSYGMGKELLDYPVFRRSIEQFEVYLQSIGVPWHFVDFFHKHKSNFDLHDAQFSQSVCTALQVALVDLFDFLKILPSVVIGHSSGEIAAAYAAGAISRESAWKLAHFRGILSSELSNIDGIAGAMLSAAIPYDLAMAYMDKLRQEAECGILCVACINSPQNVTFSGDVKCIQSMQALLDQEGIFNRKLNVPVAYHSAHMENIAATYERSIGSLMIGREQNKHIPMISSVTGRLVSTKELLCPSYWVRNMVSPVKFENAIKACLSASGTRPTKKIDLSHRNEINVSEFLEVGPHATLQSPIKETINSLSRGQATSYTSVLVRHQCAIRTLMNAMGKLYCLGHHIDIARLNYPSHLVQDLPVALPYLPEYPFDHSKTYWNESRISKNVRFRTKGRNEFLGAPVADWNPLEPRWRHFLTSSPTSLCSWIRDHKINGETLFPAAGMLVMAIEAVVQIESKSTQTIVAYEIKNAEFISGLTIPADDDGVETHLQLKVISDSSKLLDSGYEFCVYTYRNPTVSEICRGTIQVLYSDEMSTSLDNSHEAREGARSAISTGNRTLDHAPKQANSHSLYNRLYRLGYHYGDVFRRIEEVHYDDTGDAVGKVSLFKGLTVPPAVIHPATLDGILQMMLSAATRGGNTRIPTMIPTKIDRLWLSNTGLLADHPARRLHTHVSLRSSGSRSILSKICAFDPESSTIKLVAEGVEAAAIVATETTQQNLEHPRRLCFDVVYKPDVSFLTNGHLCGLLDKAQHQLTSTREIWYDIHTFVSVLIGKVSREISLADVPRNQPHLAKYFTWITHHAEQMVEPEQSLEEMYVKMHRHGRLGEIYSDLGHHLSQILTGKCNPLDFFAHKNIPGDYYELVNDLWGFSKSIQLYLELLSHKNPALRIIEVGAGTGSTTKLLLQALATATSQGYSTRYSRFDFTDISYAFVASAKTKDQFGWYPKICFGVFDVEQDPTTQGYEAESYDVVVAVNVLNATKSLQKSLRSIRKLLKKDGKTLLVELTELNTFVLPIIFGCLPGWWQSAESPRSQSPYISEKNWDELLKQNGFSGIDLLLKDSGSVWHGVSLMVSTAAESLMPRAPVEPPIGVITGFGHICETTLLQCVTAQMASSQTRVSDFQAAANDEGLTDQLSVLVYDRSWPRLDHLDEAQYAAFHAVLTKSRAIFFISSPNFGESVCPQQALIAGLSRTMRLERSDLIFTILTLDDSSEEQYSRDVAQALQNTLVGMTTGIYEPELVATDGVLTIPRVYEDDELNQTVYDMTVECDQRVAFGDRNLKLKVKSEGLLESLHFEEACDLPDHLDPKEVEVQVKAIGVNFKDVLVAMGHVKDQTFGTECSGLVLRTGDGCQVRPGDRVVMSHPDAFRCTIRCNQSLVQILPEDMSFVEAASIPTNFITAHRALVDIAHISQGEKVLIHAGAGGTGQAAIQIAQYCGAEVFTTVSSKTKKELLIQLYGITSDHILFSRDTSFAKGIMRLTNEKGVDVVLNSLSGPSLLASWECIAPYGRFIEIGKRDIISRSKLPMLQFERNVTFSAIDLAAIQRERPELIVKAIGSVLKLFSQKILHTVTPMKVFPLDQIEEAFRYLQSGKSVGKVIVEVDSKVQVRASLKTKSHWGFAKNATYVIAGGLGGQGRSVARWVVSKGAGYLLLLSRSGARNAEAAKFVDEMIAAGVKVNAPLCDISDAVTLRKVLDDCSHSMPQIKGCFQSSMVIRDAPFENMSRLDWNAALLPKLTGSWNLHTLLPRSLDFFIFLSSLTGLVGSQVQSNYAAGNSFEDYLAHQRTSQGLKATSINLSAMESEGILAEHRDIFDQIINVKQILPMSQPELFAILDQYCQPDVVRGQVITGLQLPAAVAAKGAQEPAWMSQPMFSHLHQLSSNSSSTLGKEEDATQDLYTIIKSKSSTEEITQILETAISNKLCKFLSIVPAHFDISKPLHSYGMDSLIAMELRNWILKILKIEVSVFEILGSLSAQALAQVIAQKESVLKG